MSYKFTTKSYVILVILTILMGTLYFVKVNLNSTSEKNSQVEENISIPKYFSNQLSRKIGPTFEGNDPDIIIRSYPGIVPSDFHNVKAGGGTYEFSNNKLIFNADTSSPQNSGFKGITDYETLLTNISTRLKLSINTANDIDHLIFLISKN